MYGITESLTEKLLGGRGAEGNRDSRMWGGGSLYVSVVCLYYAEGGGVGHKTLKGGEMLP